jgi:hypothetical protein
LGGLGAGDGQQGPARTIGHGIGDDLGDVQPRQQDQHGSGQDEGEIEFEIHGVCLSG